MSTLHVIQLAGVSRPGRKAYICDLSANRLTCGAYGFDGKAEARDWLDGMVTWAQYRAPETMPPNFLDRMKEAKIITLDEANEARAADGRDALKVYGGER